MLSTLSVVLPIFALILAGWLARRLGALGAAATTELSRFVVYLALPALLFDIMAHARWADLWQPGFVAAFGFGSGIVFGLTLILRLRQACPMPDSVLDALNAGYANTGFLGFPLALVALGRDAMGPTLIATILTVCVLFALAIVLIEINLQSETRPVRLGIKVGGSLLRNPLLVAPILGGIVPLAGLSLPVPAESFVRLLGGAASPCALVALGLFLADAQGAGLQRDTGSTALLVAFKLVLQPAVTWTLAVGVFDLSPAMTQTAVLLAALPTGTGPFMLAELYRRDATTTSGVVLASTVGSVLTITAYLAWIG